MESITEQVPAAEIERMMKIQEVILKAMARQLKWWEAAEIVGVTDGTIREQENGEIVWIYRCGLLTPETDMERNHPARRR